MTPTTGPTTAERTIGDWMELLASDAATPGGGGAAGLTGATGAAMLSMVGRLTVGRPKYADVDARMRDLIEAADRARAEFLEAADRDAEVFDDVMAAYRMPKDSEDERSARTAAIQRAVADAAAVPLEMARKAVDLLPLAEDATALGNAQASSDGYCAAIALYAAARCAIANVQINAAILEDPARRDELLETTYALRARAEELLEQSETAFKLRTMP